MTYLYFFEKNAKIVLTNPLKDDIIKKFQKATKNEKIKNKKTFEISC